MSGGSKNIHGPNKFFFCPCYFAREYMWSKIGAPKSIDPPGDDYSSWDSWASVNEHHPTSRTSFWLKPTHICDLLYHRFLITWLTLFFGERCSRDRSDGTFFLISQRGSCGGQASPSDASRVSQWFRGSMGRSLEPGMGHGQSEMLWMAPKGGGSCFNCFNEVPWKLVGFMANSCEWREREREGCLLQLWAAQRVSNLW